MLCALIAAASISGCLAPAESDSLGVAADALEPWESAIPWSPNPAPIAAPPSFARAQPPLPAPESESPETPEPSPPPRPAPIPLSAGAALFARIAACRRSAAEQGGGLANARAMLCVAGVLASSR